ncbi:hypothetical protein ACMV5L_01750 [Serratia plymuthica]|uniref:hypothetical protein n=1 Tax=Serratia plymuthica TaxID=82996 RepID=UPI003DA57B5F
MKWKRAICVASGPSLCREDVLLAQSAGWPLIAVNSSWEAVPECDVIYAGDWKWWSKYHERISIPAERWTCCPDAAAEFNLQQHKAGGPFNSGQRAVQFAAAHGAKQILLLGYDCSLKHGIHWHGEYRALRNPDELSIRKWKRHYALLAREMNLCGVHVVNCSRHTELRCFPQKPLPLALNENTCQQVDLIDN